MANVKIPLPIFVANLGRSKASSRLRKAVLFAREGKWFVASCPTLDIATQGLTEKEVKENMEDLINDYFRNAEHF